MLPTVHGTWAAYASSSTSAADREARELSQRMSSAFAGGGLLILFILILLAMAASGVNKFSGGLVFPYLSDLTRDERVVGAIGLVLSGGLQLQQNVYYAPLYANKVRDALKAKEPHTICSWPTHFFTACLAAGLSNVALILLGIASPIDTPILYEVSNYSNLLLSALALPLFTIAVSQIQRRLPPASWSCSLPLRLSSRSSISPASSPISSRSLRFRSRSAYQHSSPSPAASSAFTTCSTARTISLPTP